MLRYGHSTYSFRSTLVDTLMIYHIGIDWGAHREENVRSLDLCSTLWTLVHWHKNQKIQSKIFNWAMWKRMNILFQMRLWLSRDHLITLQSGWTMKTSCQLRPSSHQSLDCEFTGALTEEGMCRFPPHFQNCAHLSLDQNWLSDCACSAKQDWSTQIWTHSSSWHFGLHQHEQFDMRLMKRKCGHIILG